VIAYLQNYGASSLVDIAGYYNIEKPSITRRVQTLQEKRLVQEVKSDRDRREKIIQLTEKAEDLYRIFRERITELEFQAMSGIPDAEKLAAFEALPKIQRNVTKERCDKIEQSSALD
jgi:Transcriptional regulators